MVLIFEKQVILVCKGSGSSACITQNRRDFRVWEVALPLSGSELINEVKVFLV